ncbi:MAG: hypothetical protein M3Y72_07355 [Acidobacteriota bacterium]|nr:hypothetical protein [Acidobacteriota bacterium]
MVLDFTPERVQEIETIGARHGIYLAPLYNADGPFLRATMPGATACAT